MLANNVEDSEEEEEPRFSIYSKKGMTKTNDKKEPCLPVENVEELKWWVQ
jgi:hypothetical protein